MRKVFFLCIAIVAMLITPSCLKDDWGFVDNKPVILMGDLKTGYELKSGMATELEKDIKTIFSAKNAADAWLWRFGDGTIAIGQTVFKTYTTVGVYTLWLVATHGTLKDSTSTIINVVETSTGDDGSITLVSSTQQVDGKWQYILNASLKKISATSGAVWTNGEHVTWAQTPIDTITGFARILVTTYNDTLEVHYGRGITWNTAKGSKYAFDKDPGVGENWVLSILFKDGQIYTRDGALLVTPGVGDNYLRFSILVDTLTIYVNGSKAIPPLHSPYMELFQSNIWNNYSCSWYQGTGWSQARFLISALPKICIVRYGGNSYDKKPTDVVGSTFFSTKYNSLAFQILTRGLPPGSDEPVTYEIVPLRE